MLPNKGYRNVYSLKFHLVLVTKDMCKVIDTPIMERLHCIMTAICQKWGCVLESFAGDENHVYLSVDFPPDVQLSKLVNNLKTVSSRLIRKEFKTCLVPYCRDAFWHGTYYITSHEGMTVVQLQKYMEQHQLAGR